jgi:hypothetical protein
VTEHQGLDASAAELADDVSAIVRVVPDVVVERGIEVEDAHCRYR